MSMKFVLQAKTERRETRQKGYELICFAYSNRQKAWWGWNEAWEHYAKTTNTCRLVAVGKGTPLTPLSSKICSQNYCPCINTFTHLKLQLASYPGSSTKKRGGSLEDLITCPGDVACVVLIIKLSPMQSDSKYCLPGLYSCGWDSGPVDVGIVAGDLRFDYFTPFMS